MVIPTKFRDHLIAHLTWRGLTDYTDTNPDEPGTKDQVARFRMGDKFAVIYRVTKETEDWIITPPSARKEFNEILNHLLEGAIINEQSARQGD